ncbi:unnamed protein product [Fusarium venenatum]|uniref:Uncharacterized protein n=1 Tax=Fusarium venenatum TaxID=56646 RepID=A0A2L2TRD4_9HYPO|nr:uncharacterized protein FVRRES_00002 [Fusarium venenatum]CEI63490.1 unnamed protein product [Fusarium venenatum]
MSSKRGDGTHEGAKTHPDSTLTTDVRQQTAAVLRNIHLVLKVVTSGRGGVSNVIDSTAFITDLEASFTGMNEERNKLSPDPKRTTSHYASSHNSLVFGDIRLAYDFKFDSKADADSQMT